MYYLQVKGLPMLESPSFGILRLPFWHTGPAESSASPDAPNLTSRSRPIGAGPGAIEAVSHRGRRSQRPSVTAGGAASFLLPVCLGTRPSEQARFGFLDGAALEAGHPSPPHAPKIRAGWKRRAATALVKTQRLTGNHLACSPCIVTTANPPLT